jgi:hypothetical protein
MGGSITLPFHTSNQVHPVEGRASYKKVGQDLVVNDVGKHPS